MELSPKAHVYQDMTKTQSKSLPRAYYRCYTHYFLFLPDDVISLMVVPPMQALEQDNLRIEFCTAF